MPFQAKSTLDSVAIDPASASFAVATPEGGVLSPLRSSDEDALVAFFDTLSEQSRRFYSVRDCRAEARDRCSAIARYDKLRLVLRLGDRIAALAEFSFDMVDADFQRFAGYGISLRPGRDCRWGLCVTDEWQRRGVGAALAVSSFELAGRFGRDRVLLWGGVHSANTGAIHYYRKMGFKEAGRFTNDDGIVGIDMLRELEASSP